MEAFAPTLSSPYSHLILTLSCLIFAQFYDSFGWYGTLNTMSTDEMYKINRAAATLTIAGTPTPLPKSLTLNSGLAANTASLPTKPITITQHIYIYIYRLQNARLVIRGCTSRASGWNYMPSPYQTSTAVSEGMLTGAARRQAVIVHAPPCRSSHISFINLRNLRNQRIIHQSAYHQRAT
jgi:hypothetical protein